MIGRGLQRNGARVEKAPACDPLQVLASLTPSNLSTSKER